LQGKLNETKSFILVLIDYIDPGSTEGPHQRCEEWDECPLEEKVDGRFEKDTLEPRRLSLTCSAIRCIGTGIRFSKLFLLSFSA
jgi:hypothetical protein